MRHTTYHYRYLFVHQAIPALVLMCFIANWPAVQAQSTTDLRDPLIPGAISTPPMVSPLPGLPPAPGSGSTPLPVNPGMTSPSTLLPWVMNLPADSSNLSNTRIVTPGIGPAIQTSPGALGKMLAPYMPPPPSTSGGAPNIIHPDSAGYIPPATVTNINPGGGITGSAPTARWGGQPTRDLGLSRTFIKGQPASVVVDLGQQPAPGIKSTISYDGTTPVLPVNAQTTQDLYGSRQLFNKNGPAQITVAPF